MKHLILVFSSIFLTSVSLWAQESAPIDIEALKQAAPDMEIIDARKMGPAELDLTLKSSFFKESKERLSRVANADMLNFGVQMHTRKFLILKPAESGTQDYSMSIASAHMFSNDGAEKDKRLHYNAGFIATLATSAALDNLIDRRNYPVLGKYLSRVGAYLINCGLIAQGKEYLYDRNSSNHTVDSRDAQATCNGGIPILVVPFSVNH